MDNNYELIDSIILNNNLTLFNNCLKDCDNDFFTHKIKDIITYFENKDIKSLEVNNLQTDIHYRLSKIDKYSFKKQWHKLHKDKKIIKLKEYIKYFFVNRKSNGSEIIKLLFTKFRSNKLNSCKDVNYDPIKCQIVSINNLSYDSQTGKYSYK